MRRLSCLIALLACLVLALPAFAAPQKADAISGISSEKVLDIVKANKGKLVFINFFATWCPPCRMMEREVFSRKDVGDFMQQRFVAAKYARYDAAVDAPRWPLAARLGAAGFLVPPLLPLSLCLVVSYLLRAERNLSRYLYDYD